MLNKELTLVNVYTIAIGTTLSAGFFLLPGIAFNEAGPAVVLSYLIAVIPLIPAMFSMVELATAMPRAGGAYYFLDRSMGPFVGTIGGLGTWLALVLKTSFALIGMGAYLSIFWPDVPIVTLAIILTVLFGIVNLFGAKKTGMLQVLMVFTLLLIYLFSSDKVLLKLIHSILKVFLTKVASLFFQLQGWFTSATLESQTLPVLQKKSKILNETFRSEFFLPSVLQLWFMLLEQRLWLGCFLQMN